MRDSLLGCEYSRKVLLSFDRFRETLQTFPPDPPTRRMATVTTANKPNDRRSMQRAGVHNEVSLRLRFRWLQRTNRNGSRNHRRLGLNRLGGSFLRYFLRLLSHIGCRGAIQVQFVLHRSCQLLLIPTSQKRETHKQLSCFR